MNSTGGSAGRADPYWYEWFVGLIEVVDLLDSTSDVLSVAFQVLGIKGWDDVVVRLRRGNRRCYQVKHTRSENDLTFGDLVEHAAGNQSLLQSLFRAWLSGGLNDGGTKCILYTNREAGRRWSTTADGMRRPPLIEFNAWLSKSLLSARLLSDLVPPSDFKPAWEMWLAELTSGSDSERFEFLRALEIRDTEADLDGTVARVHQKLARAFGVSLERVVPLMDSLHRALRKWTTGHPGVTVEELCSELALPAEQMDLAPAPPPPAPFFPTRMLIANDLEKIVKASTTESVVFLSAEPGAGKTSVISWLANRRFDAPFSGIVDGRFFCFEPIRPENPVIALDASRVHPKDLWFSLLSQIREGLRGRLRELAVPLRNTLLNWQEAREHVLRLADLLGKERGRPFVLVVDGIDHAARAAQTNAAQAAEFFASLPGPDELAPKNIRLLVAGQPPEHYVQYPCWLRTPHPSVRRIDLPRLSRDDINSLYAAVQVRVPAEQQEAAIRVIEENAKGNTLAIVFAVDEATRAKSVDELSARLQSRRLADGLSAYYSSIWTHMLASVGDYSTGVEPCLASAISLARRGITAAMLSTAFPDWDKPAPWWRTLLESLGPLLSEAIDGFRVHHNDVRIFLSSKFAGYSKARQKSVTSQIADYLIRPDCDRIASHLQLFHLLCLADRIPEQADIFDVDWVFEAAALGIETNQLLFECKAAIQALPQRKKWPLVVSVACAAETLVRLINLREYSAAAEESVQTGVPPFLPSEVCVRPVTQWRSNDFSMLVADAYRLVRSGETDRALGLLKRWLDGLNLSNLASVFPDTIQHFGSIHDGVKPFDEAQIAPFGDFGNVCAGLGWAIPPGEPASEIHHKAVYAFEKGYVGALHDLQAIKSLDELLDAYPIYYLASWENLLRRLATAANWPVVREALAVLSNSKEDLSTTGQAEATWWSLRSGACEDEPSWLDPFEKVDFGISASDRSQFGHEERDGLIRAFESIARALGWKRMGLDPGDIASIVYGVYGCAPHMQEHRHAGVLVFRAAAMLGRIINASLCDGVGGAKALVKASDCGDVLSALWSNAILTDMYFGPIAADLAGELGDACGVLGGDHDIAALTAARPHAEQYHIDRRRNALWSVIQRAGDVDLLRKWVRHWLAPDGEIWNLSRDDIPGIIDSFCVLGQGIVEDKLLYDAQERRKWMLIGYLSNDEYGFEHVLDWFREAVRLSPEVWRDAGWKLWCACIACEAQAGDNRLRSTLLDRISAAAIRCGASDWWQLISTTLAEVSDNYWHAGIFSRLVDGGSCAFRENVSLSTDDVLSIWSLAILLSFWMDAGDNDSLRALCEAMLQSLPTTSREALRARLQQITPRVFVQQPPTKDHETTPEPIDHQIALSRSFPSVLEKLDNGDSLTLADAAIVMQRLEGSSSPEKEELIAKVFGAIRTDSDFVSAWHYSESHVDVSLKSIVDSANDEDLWIVLDVIGRELDHKSSWLGVNSNLHELAVARAMARGLDDLSAGLEIQLKMHMSLAFGGPRFRRPLPELPEATHGLTWQEVTLRFMPVLFESYYAEVVAAALEGMHALVASDAKVIPRLFAILSSDWSRRWLLNAAESWAALYPQELECIRGELERVINCGDFESRLQVWIILCRLSDVRGTSRPLFPIPGPTRHTVPIVRPHQHILHSPPMTKGHFQLVDQHGAASSKLYRLAACGFDFTSIEAKVADTLAKMQIHSTGDDDIGSNGARRRGAMLCTRPYEEGCIGEKVWSAMDSSWCEQSDMVRIAQAYLSNEDAWMERHPPLGFLEPGSWPENREYGSDSVECEAMRTGLMSLAMRHGIPAGWRMLSACSMDYTWKEDLVLWLWYETIPSSLLLQPTHKPTCPSGRTFLWWLGDYFEPKTGPRFVSGFFVGGMVRLHHCNVEIMPPKVLSAELGWRPQLTDPLTWHYNGEPVARYERLHGPLRDNPHSAKARQPVLHRWIVKYEAFDEIERCFGALRLKEEFEVFPFKD